jgi:hypothetical protein
VLALGLAGAAAAIPAGAASVTYQDATDEVRNPERGFYAQQDGLPGALPDVRDRGLTLVRAIFRLDPHRDAETLPEDYLQAVDGTFAQAREQGIKLIVRFAYNKGDGPDAPLDKILLHIDQLGPILQRNSDVIQVIEAGFIGAWGEWHSSANGVDTISAKEQVLRRELAAFPEEVKLAVRYPRDKRTILGATPVDEEDAHSAKARARVGHHNDCFLADDTDGGTWQDWKGATGDRERRYVDRDTAHVPMGGETCILDGSRPELSTCDTAKQQLTVQDWTALNADFYGGVLDQWRAEGCYDEIARRLGPRFALVDAEMPDRVTSGEPLDLSFRVRNDGFAAPYNRRPLEVVLRHRQTGTTTRVPTEVDPRFWGPGETAEVTVRARVPANAPSGETDVLLHLPDPSPRLRDRPEYAIRFANDQVWDAETGLNRLNLMAQVAPSVPAAAVDAVVESVERLLGKVGGT